MVTALVFSLHFPREPLGPWISFPHLCALWCAFVLSSGRVLCDRLTGSFVVKKEPLWLIWLYVKSEFVTWLHQCTPTTSLINFALLESSTLNRKRLHLMYITTPSGWLKMFLSLADQNRALYTAMISKTFLKSILSKFHVCAHKILNKEMLSICIYKMQILILQCFKLFFKKACFVWFIIKPSTRPFEQF